MLGVNSSVHRNRLPDQEFLRRLPLVICVVLAAVLLLDLLRIVRETLQSSQRQATVLAGSSSAASFWPMVPTRSRYRDRDAVIAAHLFGVAPDVAASSTKPLLLTGTITYTDNSHNTAIVGETLTSTHVFLVGAELPNGTVLDRVLNSQIVVRRAGFEEIVMIPKGRRGRFPPDVMLASNGEGPAEARTAMDVRRALDPREFSRARAWFNGLIPKQANEDGHFVGYRLQPMPRYQSAYGFKPGDLLTAINGVPIENPDTALSMLQRVIGQTISLTVQRDGQPENVTINMDGT